MIQGAHIGVGVRGKEGNQAVQASDIAVSQFRFLVPLLLCHGRRAYRRVALFLCYYIYKHIVLATADVIWAHQFRFRGEIGYPEWLSSSYSLLFTSLPIMVILAFDKDVPDSVAVSTPLLYCEGLTRARFNFKIFTLWMISGVWHGSLAWAVPSAVVGSTSFNVEYDEYEERYKPAMVKDFWLASCASFTLVVVLVDLRLWMVALNKFSGPTVFVLITSVGAYFIVLFFFGHVWTSMQPQIEGIPAEMLQEEKTLLCIFLTPLALLIDCAFYYGAKVLYPSPLDVVRRSSSRGKHNEQASEAQLVKPAQAAW
jgi:magnesium-transporting ATPase (P-type)